MKNKRLSVLLRNSETVMRKHALLCEPAISVFQQKHGLQVEQPVRDLSLEGFDSGHEPVF